MKRVLRSLLPLLALLAASGCGGSASETPWPVEPDNVDLGPVGESRAEEETTAKPKAAPPSSANPADRREPAMDDKTEAPTKSEPLAP